MTIKDLYDRDLYEWATRNAELLRSGRLAEADIEHVAEEIEDVASSQRREIQSRLRTLLAHLLKHRNEPQSDAVRGWRATIRVQRREMRDLLRHAPSLRRILENSVDEAFADALLQAADETGLPPTRFPKRCPFTLDQLLDPDYFPS